MMPPASPDALRTSLVRALRERDALHDERVAAALADVPRHLFLPRVPLEDAYADRAIPVKVEGGMPLSSASQPSMIAEMLEMLALRGGEQVLEIGSGTGYNAALLATLAGPPGSVTSVEFDDDLARDAAAHLAAAGFAGVRILHADGASRVAPDGTFDRIISTVGVERVPPAWIAELRDGGRLVAPVTLRAHQYVFAFERVPSGLRSIAAVEASFIMARGPTARETTVALPLADGDVRLRVLAGNTVDTGALGALLESPGSAAPLPVPLRLDDALVAFSLRLALADARFCRLTAPAERAAVRVPVLGGAGIQWGLATAVGLAEGAALALLAADAERRCSLRTFGDAGALGERTSDVLAAWDRDGRPGLRALRVSVDADGTMHAGYETAPQRE